MASRNFLHIIIAKQLCMKTIVLPNCYSMRYLQSSYVYLPAFSAFLLPKKASVSFNHATSFSNFPSLLKKKDRADTASCDKKLSKLASASSSDAYGFADLEEAIEICLSKLRSDLAKLGTGGKFNPEILEDLRVIVKRDGKRTERMKDLAQIIPKGGRSLKIIVGSKEHVKPIFSAIQSSSLNLQPLVDSHDQLQFTVPIPPPTKESRESALTAATKLGESSIAGIRAARAIMQKKLRHLELKRLERPDDLEKVHKKMEKAVEKATIDVKKFVDTARKLIEQV